MYGITVLHRFLFRQSYMCQRWVGENGKGDWIPVFCTPFFVFKELVTDDTEIIDGQLVELFVSTDVPQGTYVWGCSP